MNLRKATKEDGKFLFELRNEESVRNNSFNSKIISIQEHAKWFREKINNNETQIFIVEDLGERIGQVRIDASGEINIAIVPEKRGQKYGARTLQMVKKIYRGKIVAHIKLDNAHSISMFENAGFRKHGKEKFKNIICERMEYENL